MQILSASPKKNIKSILNIMEKDEYLEQFFDKIYTENVLNAMDKIANDIKEFMDV